MQKRLFLALLPILLVGCASTSTQNDPYLWLEEVEGAKALKWVKEQNERSLNELKSSERFGGIEEKIRKIVLADDRLPYPAIRGEFLYNFWRDKKSVRGIWRRTSVAEYKKAEPKWETVLDLDALAEREKDNWVWKGAHCLPPEYARCLISLSRGGKDASVVREFDTRTKEFVQGGFEIPEAKSSYSWVDADSIYVQTDFGPGTMSEAGYPLVSKLWKRGTPLAEAQEVGRGETKDLGFRSYVLFTPAGNYRFHSRWTSFFERQVVYETPSGQRQEVALPRDASFQGVMNGDLLFRLRSHLRYGKRSFEAGSLVALPIRSLGRGVDALADLALIFEPSRTQVLENVSISKRHLWIEVLDNVRGKILKGSKKGKRWVFEPLPLGKGGMASLESIDDFSDRFIAQYTDELTPQTLYWGDAATGGAPVKLKSAPARFDARGMVAEQFFAVSRDGTRVPYSVVRKKNLPLNGKNPTLLYGYGGFENSMTPGYLGTVGKVWLEQGGIWVMANIRGGGEFGPAWHQAALRENRQKSYDDFIAVAEDLIRRGFTSPKHLGIQGGSNGGLLMGVMMTQRPDLFGAIACEVPLLDMMRYHRLLAGASWVEEYGNPDDTTNPAIREAIARYSPYQNVRADAEYPRAFILTSTKDDRVHPGHARKMAAKLLGLGKPVLYFENVEGGHGGAANLEQRILWSSLVYTYLWERLK